MSSVLHKLRKSEKGFSMAEVVIAMAVFVSAIVGISMMLLSGSGAVTRGAMENTATQLAQKKIEDVKTLAFYSPWTGTNKDIDDSYFNMAYANSDPNQLTKPQTSNPVAYEDYGTISGFGQYKRTTAIQYQTVTPTQMVPTTMDANWVPKNPEGNKVVSPKFDMQKDTSGNKVRLLIVEVGIYYRLGNTGQEKSYTARAVVSDLMVTGGANNPMLVIKQINPAEGQLNNQDFQMDITVQSEGLTPADDTVSVDLWYEGQIDNPATFVTIESATLIHCHFNLKDHAPITVRPGMYNLEVYWQNKGWKDTSFRNCFTVVVASPVFDSLSNYSWGHRGQSARRLTVTGTGLDNATINLKKGLVLIPGVIPSGGNTGTEIKADFNLTSISGEDEYWDIEITTHDGRVLSNTNAKRLYVNPKPVITQITPMPPNVSCTVFDWAYASQNSRHVQIEGHYLYGFDNATTTKRLKNTTDETTRETSEAVFVSGSTYSDNNAVEGTPVVLDFDPSSGFESVEDRFNTPNTRWDPYLINAGGTANVTADSQRVLMNPDPVVTNITGLNDGSYGSPTVLTITVTGQYFRGPWDGIAGNYPMVWLQNTAVSEGDRISLNFDNCTGWNVDGTQFVVTQTYAADKFHYGSVTQVADIVVLPEPLLATYPNYKAVVQCRTGAGWPCTYTDFGCTITP